MTNITKAKYLCIKTAIESGLTREEMNEIVKKLFPLSEEEKREIMEAGTIFLESVRKLLTMKAYKELKAKTDNAGTIALLLAEDLIESISRKAGLEAELETTFTTLIN